ncbi:hypothetical protein N7530_009743 [Penicillium desertorum]|uniref:Uncharacterized protein n=1 Tax=Penicillium desertorum TaxID=1303715 RepID=A0A9X0BIN9_9EURO|nr:hypothetical protein N7530_009743 [Penicillium desertorum]
MLFLRIVAVLTALIPSLALEFPTVRTWDDLVQQDPAVKSVLLYCDLIKEPQSGCASKFLGINKEDGVSTAVAQKAAATCLQRQSLDRTAALMNMFNVDTKKMSNYATGSVLDAPPKNTHWDWSEEARQEAAKRAFESTAKENAERRAIEHSLPQWAKIFKDEHGRADSIIIVTETALDIGLAISAADKARKDPWSVNVPPDRVTPDKATSNAHPPQHDPPQHDPPQHDPPQHDPPQHDPVASETIFKGDAPVDLTDEIIATPILQDEMTRTAMQDCQESVEAELWEEIGSVSIDPNAQTPEEDKDEAEHLMLMGICDKEYYGEKACSKWKNTMQQIPLEPEVKASMDDYIKTHRGCPVNVVSKQDCHRAKQELLKRYAFPDIFVESVKDIFKPGKAIPWLPRADLGLSKAKNDFKPEMPSFKTKEDVPILFSQDGKFIPSKRRPGAGAPLGRHGRGDGSPRAPWRSLRDEL